MKRHCDEDSSMRKSARAVLTSAWRCRFWTGAGCWRGKISPFHSVSTFEMAPLSFFHLIFCRELRPAGTRMRRAF